MNTSVSIQAGDKTDEANASLIAAAPDLLAALRDLLDALDANGSAAYEMLRAAGRDAIAKVEA